MTWQKLCVVEALGESRLVKFEIDGTAVLATRFGDTIVAFPPDCPHMAEPLAASGVCEDGILTCTKHVWQWDLATGEALGLAERPLLTYPTRREGEEVWIGFAGELVYDRDC